MSFAQTRKLYVIEPLLPSPKHAGQKISRDRHVIAATPAVGVPEHRQPVRRFAFGIDRFAPAVRILTPIRNQTPAQRIERDLAGLMIAPNDEEFLARCSIPARRIIVDAVVRHVDAFDDGITYRPPRCSG